MNRRGSIPVIHVKIPVLCLCGKRLRLPLYKGGKMLCLRTCRTCHRSWRVRVQDWTAPIVGLVIDVLLIPDSTASRAPLKETP